MSANTESTKDITGEEWSPAVTVPALALVVIAGDEAEVGWLVTRWFAEDEIVHLDHAADVAKMDAVARRLADGLITVVPLVRPYTDERDIPARLAQIAHWRNVAPIALLVKDGGPWPSPLFPVGKHGFERVHHVAAGALVEREPLACDRRDQNGPFDIIGDVHGCHDEMIELFERLGYLPDEEVGMRPPTARRAVFVGDLVDRGPGVVETARLVMRMVATGVAYFVPGNHDDKLLRALMGRNVWVAHGLRDSLDQIERLPDTDAQSFSTEFQAFVHAAPPYLILDGGALVVAHAGLPQDFQGRVSPRVRALALYGDVVGEDEYGLPIRVDWAATYQGAAAVIYGHTPQREAVWRNGTINCDTGCVFGGKLTAVRWPEREIVSVPARKEYARRARPL
ncbi:MAG TPA: metallophosphoesterase [Ktedonobacterales bacterium]